MCEPSAIIPSSLRQLAQTIYQYSDNVVPHRYLLCMGGIPSAGKNTLAAQLLKALHASSPSVTSNPLPSLQPNAA